VVPGTSGRRVGLSRVSPISQFNDCVRQLLSRVKETVGPAHSPYIDRSPVTIEQYTRFVEKPMWLKKMQQHSRKGANDRVYMSRAEVLADLRLLCVNCVQFNFAPVETRSADHVPRLPNGSVHFTSENAFVNAVLTGVCRAVESWLHGPVAEDAAFREAACIRASLTTDAPPPMSSVQNLLDPAAAAAMPADPASIEAVVSEANARFLAEAGHFSPSALLVAGIEQRARRYRELHPDGVA
jgi:hypothetical protein